MTARRWRLVVPLLVVGILARPALAAPPQAPVRAVSTNEAEAARLFREGESAFTSGDYTRAGEKFERANALAPHHGVLWNAARSWLRAGDDVRAANMLEQFLRAAPDDAPERDQATASLAKLKPKLGCLEIRGEVKDIHVDESPVLGPRHYVAPGEHVATGSAEGKSLRRVVAVAAGERISVLLLATPADAPAAKPAVREQPDVPVTPPGPARASGLSPWFVAGGTGLTLVAAAATVVSALDTTSKQERFDALNGDLSSTLPARTDAFDTMRAAGRRTNIFLGVTLGLAAVTAVVAVFFVDWRAPARPGTAFGPRPRTLAWAIDVAPSGEVSLHGTLP